MLHLQVIFGLIICFHGVNSADSLSEHCETDFTGMSRNDVIEQRDLYCSSDFSCYHS